MSTTIVMLSVDEAALLEVSLPAALAQSPSVRVVVVDNACADRTVSVCEQFDRVEVVSLRTRVSYAAAMNAGFARSSGDAVLLLNADCVLDPDALRRMERVLEQRPDVGAVAPRLIRATGMAVEDRLDVLDAAGMTVDRRRKNRLVAHGDPASSRARSGPCFGGDGACVLYRRAVLDEVAVGAEVLDEDMELWATDVDLAWRVRRAGWSAWYEPAAVGWHKRFYSPTTRSQTSAEHRRIQFRNRLLMIAKNDSWRTVLPDLPFLLAYELAALAYVLLRERDLLPAYADAARRVSRVRAKRRPGGVRPPFGLEVPR